jgi:hypothetical protein
VETLAGHLRVGAAASLACNRLPVLGHCGCEGLLDRGFEGRGEFIESGFSTGCQKWRWAPWGDYHESGCY